MFVCSCRVASFVVTVLYLYHVDRQEWSYNKRHIYWFSFAHVDRRFASIVFVLEFELCCYCIYIMLIVKNGAITKGISTGLDMSVIGDINFVYIITQGISTGSVMSAIGDINFIYIITKGISIGLVTSAIGYINISFSHVECRF